MDIISAYSGLGVAFIIIASLFLYFFINSKGHIGFKMLLIPIVLWYSLVLLYMPPKMMGWPTTQEPFGENRLIQLLIKEPFKNNPGAIYLLVIGDEGEKVSLMNKMLNPKYTFEYNQENTPRFFKIPYDRELHKQLKDAEAEAARKKGFIKLKFLKKKNKKGKKGKSGQGAREGRSVSSKEHIFKIRIIEPMQVLRKNTEEAIRQNNL